ncbi:hypothetical protein [Rubellimicrobium aerolatum]|uniref:Uncharacterized protein n=1 Tax=Rubellimicrobium aerolatum TaxID=490979 RepID=A0ABW0SDH9_9RHOB|nr:hypothetical protein [Rubellimicrobium aerolatum]MBP1805767.1 hypothetical protein [Rubellimicrobium aerolatum]
MKQRGDPDRSYVDWIVDGSSWEGNLAQVIANHPRVVACAKNHDFGFEVPYPEEGEPHRYRLDFVIRLDLRDARGRGQGWARRQGRAQGRGDVFPTRLPFPKPGIDMAEPRAVAMAILRIGLDIASMMPRRQAPSSSRRATPTSSPAPGSASTRA